MTKHKIEAGRVVETCFATDLFLPEADEWRAEAWQIIKSRPDLHFLFYTKRIDRFYVALPEDWGDGYDNVTVGCTVENQEMADYRLPLFLSYPIKHRNIGCSPLLSHIWLQPYLHGVRKVTVGGEAGREARECRLDWVLDMRRQCEDAGVAFWFKSTGSRFVADGILHKINPRMEHRTARELHLNIGEEQDDIL